MTTPAEVVDRLNGSTRHESAAFAAACTTRLAPVFESFARADKSRFHEWLKQLWLFIDSSNLAGGQELQHQIMSAPEASVDDSNRPDYYAMRTLGVLFYAVQALLDQNPAEPALQCSRATVALLRDLDYILQIIPGSAGSLVEIELLAEREWATAFTRGQQDTTDRLKSIRTADLSERLEEVAHEIAQVHDWDLREWSR